MKYVFFTVGHHGMTGVAASLIPYDTIDLLG